jgi:hypothetical protein
VRRALVVGMVGRRFEDVFKGDAGGRVWVGGVECERVRWAVCPGVKEKMRFWEGVAAG